MGRLNPGDGPVEPGVGEEEVIVLLHTLLCQGEGHGAWRGEQRDTKISLFWIILFDLFVNAFEGKWIK